MDAVFGQMTGAGMPAPYPHHTYFFALYATAGGIMERLTTCSVI